MATKVRMPRPKVDLSGGVKSTYYDYLAGAAYFLGAALQTGEGKNPANRQWIGEVVKRIENTIKEEQNREIRKISSRKTGSLKSKI